MTSKVNNLLVIKNFHNIGEPFSACFFKIFSNDVKVVKLHYKFSHFCLACNDLSNGKHQNSKVNQDFPNMRCTSNALKSLQQDFIEKNVSISHLGQLFVHPPAYGAGSMRLSGYGMTNIVCQQKDLAAPSSRTKTPDFTAYPYQWAEEIRTSSDLLAKVAKNKIQNRRKKSSKPSPYSALPSTRPLSMEDVRLWEQRRQRLPPLVIASPEANTKGDRTTFGGRRREATGGYPKVCHPFLLSGVFLRNSFKSAAFASTIGGGDHRRWPVYREGDYPLERVALSTKGGGQPSLFWEIKSKKNTYKVVRPMLSCSRAEITKLCRSWRLPVYPDQSNDFTQYSRNRIRKQLLPAIRFFFNPKVENAIFQFTEIVADEHFLINKTVNHLLTVFPLFQSTSASID